MRTTLILVGLLLVLVVCGCGWWLVTNRSLFAQ
jgi:hypothetical protein